MEKSVQFDITAILETTLNLVDRRLIDHGKRVAYLVYQALKLRGGLSESHVRDICLLATIHDIGAYKTDEIDKMLEFETKDVWPHSIYGYLFVKYLSPLSYLAPVLLFHHASLSELKHLPPSYHRLTQLIFVADRIDIVRQTSASGRKDILAKINTQSGTCFDPSIVQWLSDIDVDWDAQDFGCDSDAAYRKALHGFNNSYTIDQKFDLLKMIIYSMEFRSPQTVTHTVTCAQVAHCLGELLGLPEQQLERLRLASLVHDIGKMGIPTYILESPNRFTAPEYQIIQQHVVFTSEILQGKMDPTIIRPASRHHERLDGSGYPNGLSGAVLTMEDRIIAVADVFNALCGIRTYKDPYPKEQVLRILEDSRDHNQLDPTLINLCITHYEEILTDMQASAKPLIEAYEQMRCVYVFMKDATSKISKPDNGVDLLVNKELTAFSL